MSMLFKRRLLIVLCAVGIPTILIASLLVNNLAAPPHASLRLTEIMNNNLSCLADADGSYYDWVELTNTGDRAVSLDGLSLTDDPTEPDTFLFFDTTLEAGASLVIFLTGDAKEARAGYAPFGLADNGDTVHLYEGNTLLDSLTVGSSPENVSYGLHNGNLVWFATPTPGTANNGICAATTDELADACYTGVMISEVCAVSRSRDQSCPTDWVEFTNTGNTTISLAGYELTNDITATGFVFPDILLNAGEHLLVYCDKKSTDNEALCAPFSLSPHGETLFLRTPEGVVCDRFESGKQRYGITSGRVGTDRRSRVYFETPTPGTANGNGLAGYAPMPAVSRAGGYANETVSVTLSVPTACQVYYTTDGSEPTATDTQYTAGNIITLSKTTTLRAVALREGYLPSDVLTETYLLGEAHDLPVVSVTGDPQALFGGNGAFTQYTDKTKEVAVHTEYFEQDGTKAVAFDSLLRIAGGLSRRNVQKAFSLNLNQTTGKSTVSYPFFDKASTQEFHNLLLRPSGSDWDSAKLRDEFAAAALDGEDGFVIQGVRPVALYINGTYHGLYYLREKRNEDFVSAETGISKDQIELAQSPAVYESQQLTNSDMLALIQYARTHDLTVEEYYQHVLAQVDTDSLIRFYVAETWFGNGDMINNVAYYRNTQDGKWHWIIFDMDWACTAYYADYQFIRQLYNGTGVRTYRNYYDPLMTALLKNGDFRHQFLTTYKALMATTLSADRLLPILDELASSIESEIPRQYARYGAPSVTKWTNQVAYIRNFVRTRESTITRELCDVFDLTEDEWNAL